MNRILYRNHHARDSCKLFRHGKRLRKIPLHLTGTIYGQLVLIRQLVHSKNRDDILKFLVPLKNLNHPLGGLIMSLSYNVRIQDAG